MSRGCSAVRGGMVGILVIGSYVYHSDVIVTNTQIYVNRIQIHLTYYSPVYCIYKLVSQCHSCHNVPQISSSMLCRLWGVQDKNTNTMMIPTLCS